MGKSSIGPFWSTTKHIPNEINTGEEKKEKNKNKNEGKLMERRLYFSCIELNLKVQEYIQPTRMFDSSQKRLRVVILRRLNIQQCLWLNNYYFQHMLFCVGYRTVSKIKALLLVSQNKGPGVWYRRGELTQKKLIRERWWFGIANHGNKKQCCIILMNLY